MPCEMTRSDIKAQGTGTMNFIRLESVTQNALRLLKLETDNSTASVKPEIMAQLAFILACAQYEKNPRDELPEGKAFTFGVLTSRYFTAPIYSEFLRNIDVLFEELLT